VGGDLATRADGGVLLDFDEGPYTAVISNGAPIEIHLIRVKDLDVGSQFTGV
jgi:hypothetical protein